MAFLQINYYSRSLNMSTRINAVVPDQGKDIPCLYLLHGIGGDCSSWERYGGIERHVEHRNMAVIMPETYLGAYANTAYGMNYWDYFTVELPQFIGSMFPQISPEREKNFVAGQSMGGYGAFKLGMGTDRFCAAASMSGALHDLGNPESAGSILRFGSPSLFEGIFGDLNLVRGSNNDIYALAQKRLQSGKPIPKLYFSCGKQDPFYLANLGAKRLLGEMGIPFDYRESDGTHDWEFWNTEIQNILEWLPI